MNVTKNDTTLAARLQAVAHPARVAILRRLTAKGKACAGEIAKTLRMPASTLSHHLRMMEDAGIIKREREGTFLFYRLQAGALASLGRALSEA